MRLPAFMVLISFALAGCHHERTLDIEVPPIETLRSFVPAHLRIQLRPVEPAKDGRIAFEKAVAIFPSRKFDTARKYDTLALIKKSTVKCIEDLKPWEEAMDKTAAASALPDWTSSAGGDHEVDVQIGAEGIPNEPSRATLELQTKVILTPLIARARARALKSDARSADDYLTGLRLATAQMSGRGLIINYLIGTTLLSLDVRAIQKDAANLPEPAIRKLISELPNEDSLNGKLADSLRAELDGNLREFRVGIADDNRRMEGRTDPIFKALLDHPKPFDPAETVKLFATGYDATLKATSLPFSQRGDLYTPTQNLQVEMPDLDGDTPSKESPDVIKAKLSQVTNPMGRLLFEQISSFGLCESLLKSLARSKTEIAATRTTLALSLYKRMHGHFPSSLQILVDEKMLPKMPIDAFDGKPLRYDASRAILWCVSENGKDDGGHDVPWAFGATDKDLVWPIDGHLNAR